MDKAIAKLQEIKDKNGESFLGKWEKVIFDAGYEDMEFEYGLVELINSILDKLATKIEEETYTENREEDNLVEHIVNEIRKFIPEPLILLRAILTNKGEINGRVLKSNSALR